MVHSLGVAAVVVGRVVETTIPRRRDFVLVEEREHSGVAGSGFAAPLV